MALVCGDALRAARLAGVCEEGDRAQAVGGVGGQHEVAEERSRGKEDNQDESDKEQKKKVIIT